ncbi:ribosome-associated protein [Tenacibaculum sp. MAR_2009_124]|uniref:alternative ribosome rescue aminoacyl-tRNA hydrolase ArfB n=1 Tax=Tenacibaculum sp. MAR_2009_124 TaxID=1250059 RepID=UPI00089B4D57|nr:alternative ribosome rescue aminoacyl-tRNA hydrolase ArfB [Tenacibaculum sp. MAR_2009_124]SEC25000.1 ribosome-associated protein [Tenacibaculum sp. MAR_2009_124]
MQKDQVLKELSFKAIRSSGSGGQHVNKVSSKVELSFSIAASEGLSDNEKDRLLKKLSGKLSKEGSITLTSQESRSQHRNKELVIERFLNLIQQALIVPKVRRKTKPSRASKRKRLDSKKQHSEKKDNRKKFRF